MQHVDPLPDVLGSDVRHHVGRLLAAENAVGTLKTRRLAALVLPMPGHVTLNGEATTALGAREGFLRGLCVAGLRIVAVVALGVEALGLKYEVEVQLRYRPVEP